MTRLRLIDYGSGNLHSCARALAAAAEDPGKVMVTARPEDILAAERIVLPGVGHFADCAGALRAIPGMVEALEEAVLRKGTPFLGICVGLQLLFEESEEGGRGLGLLAGPVRRVRAPRVPHMGWNEVAQSVKHPLWHNIPDLARFYFVHSYYIEAGNPKEVVGRGHYGKDFAAALAEGSRFAVQFHPEKSHTHGLQLLQNFAAWDGRW